jgi:Rrf2 family protein
VRFITRDTDYALRALVFMAKAGKKEKNGIVTVDDIAKGQKLPRIFLRRILQKLANNKVLTSYKGRSGGFSFLVNPEKIKITNIIRIFQGDIDLTHCFLKTAICPNIKVCTFRKKLKSLNSIVNKELEKIKISSLI